MGLGDEEYYPPLDLPRLSDDNQANKIGYGLVLGGQAATAYSAIAVCFLPAMGPSSCFAQGGTRSWSG